MAITSILLRAPGGAAGAGGAPVNGDNEPQDGEAGIQCKSGYVVADNAASWATLPHMYVATHKGAMASKEFEGDIFIDSANVDKLAAFLKANNPTLSDLLNSITSTGAYKKFVADGKIDKTEIETIPESKTTTTGTGRSKIETTNDHFRADIIQNYQLVAGLSELFAKSECGVLPEETGVGKLKTNALPAGIGLAIGVVGGVLVGRRLGKGKKGTTEAPATVEPVVTAPKTKYSMLERLKRRSARKAAVKEADKALVEHKEAGKPKNATDDAVKAQRLQTAAARAQAAQTRFVANGGDINARGGIFAPNRKRWGKVKDIVNPPQPPATPAPAPAPAPAPEPDPAPEPNPALPAPPSAGPGPGAP